MSSRENTGSGNRSHAHPSEMVGEPDIHPYTIIDHYRNGLVLSVSNASQKVNRRIGQRFEGISGEEALTIALYGAATLVVAGAVPYLDTTGNDVANLFSSTYDFRSHFDFLKSLK